MTPVQPAYVAKMTRQEAPQSPREKAIMYMRHYFRVGAHLQPDPNLPLPAGADSEIAEIVDLIIEATVAEISARQSPANLSQGAAPSIPRTPPLQPSAGGLKGSTES